MSEPRMIRDIQHDEDHDEVMKFLTDRINDLEADVKAKPISFSVREFFAFVVVISSISYIVSWLISLA